MPKPMTVYDLGQWDYINDNVKAHDAKPKRWSQDDWSAYWEGVNDAFGADCPDIASAMLLGNYDG